MQEKTRQGIPAATSTMAFGDYLTYWLPQSRRDRLKPSTLNSYEGLTRLYIRPALGKKKLNRLSPADIRLFLAEFKNGCLCCLRGVGQGSAPRTKPDVLRGGPCCKRRPSARTVQYARRTPVLASTGGPGRTDRPQRRADRGDPHRRHARRSVRWSRRSPDAAQDRPNPPALCPVAAADLHRPAPGEVLALTWADIDLDERTASGAAETPANPAGADLRHAENGALAPTISLPKRCVTGSRPSPRPAGAGTKGGAALEGQPARAADGLVFTTATGRATDPRSLNRMLTSCAGTPRYAGCACTTSGTPAPRSCSPRAWTPARSWRRWGTAPSR